MQFKDFQRPIVYSGTFRALTFANKIQVLPMTFKDEWEPCPKPTKLNFGGIFKWKFTLPWSLMVEKSLI